MSLSSPRDAATATIDGILQNIAAHPGTSVGIPLTHIRHCFDALCAELAAELERRRSVVVPDFCHLLVQQHVRHSGTWGARVTWVPVFMLLPTFCQRFNCLPTGQTSVNHMGATTPASVNSSALYVACQGLINRHGIINIIRDIVREIGNFVASGRTLTVDFKFCTVRFHGGKASAIFASRFIDQLNMGNSRQVSLAPSPRTMSHSPRRPSALHMVPTPPTEGQQNRAPPPPLPPKRLDHLESLDTAPHIPAPPPPHTPSRPSVTPASAQGQRQPSTTPTSAQGKNEALIDAFISPRRKAMESALSAKLSAIAASYPSPHLRRAARKLAYRRIRNLAYESSWDLSIKERKEAAEREAAADKETARMIEEIQAKADEQERQEAEQRRAELRQIQGVNKELDRMRRAAEIVPRTTHPGDIFDARLRTAPAAHDTTALKAQIEERRQREQEAKVEARRYGDAAWQDFVSSQEEERRRKAALKAERQAMVDEHRKAASERRQLKESEMLRERLIEAECRGLAFGTDSERFKTRSIEIQKSNYDLLKQRALDRESHAKLEKAERERLNRTTEAQDAAVREQEHRAKTARQQALRASWEAQISEKEARRRAEKSERDSWCDVNMLRNESSDDEQDSIRTSKLPPRRVPPPMF